MLREQSCLVVKKKCICLNPCYENSTDIANLLLPSTKQQMPLSTHFGNQGWTEHIKKQHNYNLPEGDSK